MFIMLGNLSIEEIEIRSGITFPEDLKSYMATRHQPEAGNVKPSKWHCFDIPFTLVCGDRETATEIYKYLKPFSSEFKEPLQIALA